MDWQKIILATSGIGALGVLFGAGLALAAKQFAVKRDPKEDQVAEALPNANCGACGYPSCAQLAKDIVGGVADVSACNVCTAEHSVHIAKILGVEAQEREPQIAAPQCVGGTSCQDRFVYEGVTDCRASFLLHGGQKACSWACLGLGTCERACPFDAIVMGKDGLPEISSVLCTGCSQCVAACPANVLTLWPRGKKVCIRCRNEGKGKAVTDICKSGCVGCQTCLRACPVDAVSMREGAARIDPELCVSCGLCARACPVQCIEDRSIERSKALIDENLCIGCTLCARVCPVSAIDGTAKEAHRVRPDDCIGCGLCVARCPKNAISR